MWGILENFHEGWYHSSTLKNIAMLLGQYLSPMLGFLVLGGLSIRWPRIGAVLHVLLSIFALRFFTNSLAAQSLIVTPLLLLAVLYFFATFQGKLAPLVVLVGCPVVTLIGFGLEPAIRVASRIDDGQLGTHCTQYKDQELIWAPIGPGWPTSGTSWHSAKDVCSRLELDGKTLSEQPLNIWRLPTPAEIVAAQYRANQPCNGVYDERTQTASYQTRPDKETPMWNPRSQVIYMWTAEEIDDSTALMIVYDGKLWPRPKDARWGYLGFRAVRTATEQESGREPE
ncbi:MAG TPA: hypothetical protein DDW52_05150 [Planctomycetaceae bacterium]|nr:hypothetical protein [Planctomycetaceae bacterium]